jgi:hypothetical protein
MRTSFGVAAAGVLAVVLVAVPARAQQTSGGGGKTAAWTAVGAGAGFGIGLWAGLTAFDDAINSDRKVWTSAIVGAAAGGTLAFLLSRGTRRPSPSATPRTAGTPGARVATAPGLTDRDIGLLAASTRLRR